VTLINIHSEVHRKLLPSISSVPVWFQYESLQRSLQQLVTARYGVYGEFAGVGKLLCYMEYISTYQHNNRHLYRLYRESIYSILLCCSTV